MDPGSSRESRAFHREKRTAVSAGAMGKEGCV